MNDLQNKLLGGYAAVRINNKQEFEAVIEWLAIKNCFLANKEPITKMNYPGDSMFVLYRADDGFIWWAPVNDVDTNKYQLVDVKQLELNLIDDQKIVEANVTVTSEVTELNEQVLTLVTNTKPEGATIDSNIDNLVALIPVIKAKANVVVTEENYKSFIAKGTGVVPELRKWAKAIDDERKRSKKVYMDSFATYENKVKSVIDALNSTAQKIADDVDIYVQEQKEKARKEKQESIEQLKAALIKNGMISKEYADKFVFDEKWLNASCSNKKFQDEVEKQFNALMEQEKNDKQSLALIESTIVNTCAMAGVDEKLISREKYRLQYQAGNNLGEITKNITDEINVLKKQKEAIVEAHKREDALKEEQVKKQQEEAEKRHQEELKQAIQNRSVPTGTNVNILADEKTGVPYARTTDKGITIAIQEAPANFPEDKIFSYTYTFEGNCKAILTFIKCLKALSKVFKSFKYMEVK